MYVCVCVNVCMCLCSQPGIVSPDLMMGGGFADDAAYLQSPSATGGSASAAAAAGTSAQVGPDHLHIVHVSHYCKSTNFRPIRISAFQG